MLWLLLLLAFWRLYRHLINLRRRTGAKPQRLNPHPYRSLWHGWKPCPSRTQLRDDFQSCSRFFPAEVQTYNFCGSDLFRRSGLTTEITDWSRIPVFTHFVRRFFLVAVLTVAMAFPVWAQRQTTPPPAPPVDRNGLGTAPGDEDEASARLAHDMAK